MSLTPHKLGEIATITSSKRIFFNEYVDSGVPFYRSKEIIQFFNNETNSQPLYIAEAKYSQIKEKFGVPKINDLLLTSVGTIGVPYLVKDDNPFYFKDGNLTWFRDLEKKVVPKYFFYLLQTPSTRSLLNTRAKGSSQPAVTIESLKDIELAFHNLEAQRKIVDILSGYDDLIENNRRRIELLEESARLLYREWFVHFRFPGHEHSEIKDALPSGWIKAKLSDVADVNHRTIGRNYQGPIKYIDISAVTPGRINLAQEYDFAEAPSRAQRVVKHGDILWSCVRPNRRSHAIVWKPAENLIASTGFAVITPTHLPTSYLYHAITTDDYVGYLSNNARGVAYPAVTGTDFENSRIVKPLPQIVQLFDDIVEPVLTQIYILNEGNVRLAQSRDILLPKLMNGEVAV